MSSYGSGASVVIGTNIASDFLSSSALIPRSSSKTAERVQASEGAARTAPPSAIEKMRCGSDTLRNVVFTDTVSSAACLWP